jgi:hypothetical protein
MKKFLLVLSLFCFAAVLFADNTTTAYTNSETSNMKANHAPKDIVVLSLYTKSTNATQDTFAAGDKHLHGPYPLSSSENTGIFSGFQIVGDAITGTTATMAIDFQVLPSLSIKDTSAWTATDTLGTTATNQYQALSSYPGKGILFRVNNYDNTASQIPGQLKIMFKENWTYEMTR